MTTLFNVSRTGAVRYWSISIDKHILTIEYGQEGTNQPVTTTYTGKLKNAGKANEITAENDALNEMERLILSKTRKGYRPGRSLIENTNDVDFDSIPVNLRFYKPQSKVTKQAEDMVVNGNPIVTRKYDGEMMVVVCNDGDVQIFSRTMLPTHHVDKQSWNDRFPSIVEAFSGLEGQHIFTGEMVKDPYGPDDRKHVARVLKSKTEKAIEVQQQDGWLRYIIWDWPVIYGKKNTETYQKRLSTIDDLVEQLPDVNEKPYWVERPEIFFDSKCTQRPTDAKSFIESFKQEAEKLGLEGFVLADGDATYADKLYNFRGKTDRPKTFCKIKPVYEDDFIAYWDPEAGDGTYGRGKAEGLLGSVALYQLDKDDELVYICDCGGGFNDAFREEARKEDFPLVMEVMYESRTYTSKGSDTNALQFPRMVRTRHDKTIEECINEHL